MPTTKKEQAAKWPKLKVAKDGPPAHVTKKGRNYGQVCLGPCNAWKPLTEFSRKSKTRGGESPFGTIRICKLCIAMQAKARREKRAAQIKAEPKPKARRTKPASRKS